MVGLSPGYGVGASVGGKLYALAVAGITPFGCMRLTNTDAPRATRPRRCGFRSCVVPVLPGDVSVGIARNHRDGSVSFDVRGTGRRQRNKGRNAVRVTTPEREGNWLFDYYSNGSGCRQLAIGTFFCRVWRRCPNGQAGAVGWGNYSGLSVSTNASSALPIPDACDLLQFLHIGDGDATVA